jgi:hypothetical protein
MGTFLLLLVIAAIAGGIYWNRQTSAAASAGVVFEVTRPPDAVADAIEAVLCQGGLTRMKNGLVGVRVRRSGRWRFVYESRLGDEGHIAIEPSGQGGSTVRANSTALYVGSHPSSHFRSGIAGFAAIITHRTFTLAGISPGAARMKRFQTGLERQIRKATLTLPG